MKLTELPKIRIWSDEAPNLTKVKFYKGKFVVTEENKFFAKLFPKDQWDGSAFFHNMILKEMGVENADSHAVKQEVPGGGKIEVELISDYVEVRLYGKSTIYGRYAPEDINIDEIEEVIRTIFVIPDIPVLVIPDF